MPSPWAVSKGVGRCWGSALRLMKFKTVGVFSYGLNSSSRALASFKSGVSEALSEPVVDRGEPGACFITRTLLCQQPREAHSRSQLPGLRFHV